MCKRIFILIFLFVVTNTFYAQSVSTLTGDFNASGDVAVDSSGNIYVGNYGTYLNSAGGMEVIKVTPDGEVSVFATGLNGASGNEIGPDGYLYQSNISAGKISRIALDGTVSTYSEGHTGPVGLTFDNDGNLYVANCGANTIRKVTPEGVNTLFCSDNLLNCPNGLTSDNEGNLYTCNFGNGRVIKITPDGTASLFVSLAGRNNGHMTFKNNRLYVVSRGGNRIFEVGLDASVKTLAGTGARGQADGPADQATFSLPNGIGLSPDGNTIYVNDEILLTGNNVLNPVVIRKITGVLGEITDINNKLTDKEFVLQQNYPNPFNPATIINYSTRENAFISLKIYDTLGREIRTLVNEYKPSGNYSIQFNADNISSGIYYYILTAGGYKETKKMILIK